MKVLGAISAVIGILDVSKKVWNSAQKDINLPETFIEVAIKLPILQDTLQTCYDQLRPISGTLPKDVAESFEKTLEETKEQARALRDIFDEMIPGSDAKRMERYKKAVKKIGKGKKVEDLMKGISEAAKQLADYHAVKSARPDVIQKLEKLIEELNALERSIPQESIPGYVFNNYDGKQYNNTGEGRMYNYDSSGGPQHFGAASN